VRRCLYLINSSKADHLFSPSPYFFLIIKCSSHFNGPLETSFTVWSISDDLENFNDSDWYDWSIPKLLSFAPHIEEVLKKGTSHRLIGGLFLPIDTIERDDDEDEWQYHNNR
jgi:hypothetical protein